MCLRVWNVSACVLFVFVWRVCKCVSCVLNECVLCVSVVFVRSV